MGPFDNDTHRSPEGCIISQDYLIAITLIFQCVLNSNCKGFVWDLTNIHIVDVKNEETERPSERERPSGRFLQVNLHKYILYII